MSLNVIPAHLIKDRVTEYARDVLAGKYVVGNLHYLACKRHLDDLKRQNTADFPYYYDSTAANNILNYAEMLTILEGSEPKPLRLIDAQAFDLGCTFGWKRTDNNKRRFRRRYKSVSRQQGKSLENGIMATYIAGFSGYNYGKLYTVATEKRQAKVVWDEMAKIIRAEPDLQYDRLTNPAGIFEVKEYKSLITAVNTGCTIEYLSRESGLKDGFRPIFASLDELHQHRDNKLYEAMWKGSRQLAETLISVITTRGDNLNSFAKEMDDYCVSILKGAAKAEDYFVDIYCLDEDDNIWDEKNWPKANPFTYNCGESWPIENLQRDADTAKHTGGKTLRDFVIKSLNLWYENTDRNFVKTTDWMKGASKKSLKDYAGRSCTVGLDLSSGGDLTSYTLEFEDIIEDPNTLLNRSQYFFHSHSFMPRKRFQEHIINDLAPYDVWEKEGLITITGGAADAKNDYKFIIKELKELQEKYKLTYTAIGIDPHNADAFYSDLEEFGCPIIAITQSARNLNDATADLQLLIKQGDVFFNENNGLLTWSVVNAYTVQNSFEEIKIDKKDGKVGARIDPVDAMVDAHYAMLKMKKENGGNVDYNALVDDYLKLFT